MLKLAFNENGGYKMVDQGIPLNVYFVIVLCFVAFFFVGIPLIINHGRNNKLKG